MKVWDLHCDTLYELRRAEKAGAPKSFLHNDLHIDLEKLRQGDYLLQCFAAYVDLADPAPGADPLVSVLEEIDIFKRLMAAYPEKIAPVYTAADLERNRAEGKLSAMLTVEEGGCCKGSLGVLRRLQELGVRMMTLTWNYPNELAAPNANPGGPLVANTETGLTERGFAFLEEMEKLHITADVSHLSDKGFWDIANHSTRPFAASHSNCRALSPHNRNLTDEMIRALAEKGGIAGLNYCASFVDADSAHPKLCRSTVERLAKHAAHFKQVGGIEVISLGSDFDGIGGQHELETAADMPLLAEALRREGFTEDDAKAWTARMENEDGTTGPHWTMEQTDAVANITGVSVKPCTWWAAMNMMYSDYYGVAAKYGLDRPEFYADLAKAFIMDKDVGGPEEKMAGYCHGVVKRE